MSSQSLSLLMPREYSLGELYDKQKQTAAFGVPTQTAICFSLLFYYVTISLVHVIYPVQEYGCLRPCGIAQGIETASTALHQAFLYNRGCTVYRIV